MPSAGFEPAIPATKRPQTYALDCAANGIEIYFYPATDPRGCAREQRAPPADGQITLRVRAGVSKLIAVSACPPHGMPDHVSGRTFTAQSLTALFRPPTLSVLFCTR
jgi:hypothetical protein